MKLIIAMKKIKDLQRKADDIRKLVGQYHADMEHEKPVYGTVQEQTDKVSSWLQAHQDIIKEIGSLRFGIQKTNIATQVSIDIAGKSIKKTIAEWIARRKDLADLDGSIWRQLNDKQLPVVAKLKHTNGADVETHIRRYYSPSIRDAKMEEYRSEPSLIDANLEVVNAVTDLIE